MYSTHLYFAQMLMQARVEEALRTAETYRLLREGGIRQRGWLSRAACWLLCQMGRLLVALGRALLERYQLQPLLLDEQPT